MDKGNCIKKKETKNYKSMTYNEETRILRADDGKWITNGDTYAIEAKLAPSDVVANWREVDHLPEPDETKIDYLANEYINTEPEE